jgi:hypothetical protein
MTRVMRSLLLAGLCASLCSALSCTDKCITAGYCCTGNSSGCQHPSCQIGCVVAAGSESESACNATCAAAKGCSFVFKGQTFGMCGGCSARWLNPETLQPEVLDGPQPYWPPGWDIGGCGSCDEVQCQVGCRFAFNPSLAPTPPVSPTPLPPKPYPPAPFPNTGPGFNISAVFSDHMVLQQAPAMAAVYGNTGNADDSGQVTVTVTPSAGAPYTVPAAVRAGRWKALLRPTPGSTGLSYTISASCTAGSGCSGASTLSDVLFGDVYYCAGQSS